MPELPEVEVLVRHLAPLIRNKIIRQVEVRRARVLAQTPVEHFTRTLVGARFRELSRRGKYLRFVLSAGKRRLVLLGHLGMTGRMYFVPARQPLPKHAAVVLNCGQQNFVFEDTRYFGRLTLDTAVLERLGPEPLGDQFTVREFAAALKRSRQAVKVKLLDQALVAGLGNIYANESLFQARISPMLPARKLTAKQVVSLHRAIREVLAQAIDTGSTLPLDYPGTADGDGMFYFGRAGGARSNCEERFGVYDRAGQPCVRCGSKIRRLVQAARSTFYCSHCQHR